MTVPITVWDALRWNDSPRCRVVAELSNAHNGDQDRMGRLIEAAWLAGADAVKFQAYTPQELIDLRGDGPAPEPWASQGFTMRQLYEQAMTPRSWLQALTTQCREARIPWFASVFGPGSLAVMELLGCPVYKIAALDHRARRWRNVVLATMKPVISSVPAARPGRLLPHEVALYCPPGYPQMTIDLTAIPRFTGFSYHGTDPMWPAAAAHHGAKILEVHVHLDDEPSELEANVCLTISDLKRLCDHVHTL